MILAKNNFAKNLSQVKNDEKRHFWSKFHFRDYPYSDVQKKSTHNSEKRRDSVLSTIGKVNKASFADSDKNE